MKTSNKLLLGLFILIIISNVIILSVIKSSFSDVGWKFETTISGNAEMKYDLKKFNKIEVLVKVNIHYTQDSVQSIVVKADSNMINFVELQVSDSKLTISGNVFRKSNNPIDIYIKNDSINNVDLEGGATFKSLNKINVDNFNANVSAGAIFSFDANLVKLNLDASAGSVVNLKGNSSEIAIESSAGSVINAGELSAKSGKVSASAGSIITVNVIDELSVEASAGAIITSKGNPKLKDIDVSSGAQFFK